MEASSLPAPLAAGRRLPFPRALALPAWTAFVAALLLLRDRGIPLWDTVWAEDASVFLQGALHQSLAASVTEPYAGYLHVPSRLLAEVAVLFPPDRWALVLALMSAIVTAGLTAYVFAASATVLTSTWARALAAALPVIAGVGWEVPGAIANLHWYGLYAAFWALMTRPRSRGELAAAAVVATGAALSDPLVGLMLPLALLQARALRGPLTRRVAVLAPLSVALGVQGFVALTGDGPQRFSPFHLSDVAAIYGQRVAGGALLGNEWFETLWRVWSWDAVCAALAVAAAMVALAARETAGRRHGLVLAAAAGSVLYLLVPLAMRGTEALMPQSEPLDPGSLGGSRYMLVPAVLLLLCPIVALDARGTPRARAAFAALLAVVAISNLGLVTPRTEGPAWSDGVRHAEVACAAGARDAFVEAPPAAAENWGVSIPCRRLADPR
jgi:hypothetical protein